MSLLRDITRRISRRMRDPAHLFPVGARVYVDGHDLAKIRAAFPNGSSSFAFPHYKVDFVGGDKNVAIRLDRVGVDKRSSGRDRVTRTRSHSRDPQAQPYTYSITYETWDEEALEAGETNDKGFEIEDEPATLRELVKVIEDGGFNEPSVWPLTEENATRFWLTTSDADEDYRTGEHTYRSIHIKGSDRAMRRLVQVLRAENPRWARDMSRRRARRRR